MKEFTEEQEQKRKKAIFNSMGKRGQKQILKKGYDEWDPFQEPKDPVKIMKKKDATKKTTQQLIREFLQQVDSEKYNNVYAKGAFDICLGIINEKEEFLGMYDFVCWYQKEREKVKN